MRYPSLALLLCLQVAFPAMASATILRAYTFDDGGLPDPQDWTTHDLTVQYGVFFHVEDFAGFPPPRVPLAGNRSMWCGLASNLADPAFAFIPGFGNCWVQYLESADCLVPPNQAVQFSYRIAHGLFNFDHVDVEYRSALDTWVPITTYTGTDNSGSVKSHVIPAGSVGPVIRFRFVLATSITGSDEDGHASSGAVTLDEINILAPGFSNSETFETTPVGQTTAGIWTASAGGSFGDYGGLVSGAAVVQSAPVNSSHVWAFFNGSTETYACGGYPAQAAVPKTAHPGSKRVNDYLVNEVRSPLIDLSVDQSGNPIWIPLDGFTAEFDAYLDLPIATNEVMLTWRWRFVVGGAFQPWTYRGILSYSDTPMWYHFGTVDFGDVVFPAGATHLEFGLIALDRAYNTGNTGQCHSQSPLLDNVVLHGFYSDPTAVDGAPAPAAFALLANAPNPFNPTTTIAYEVPASGTHVLIEIFDVSGRLVRGLVDEQRPGGRWSVRWTGEDSRGQRVASGIYLYRMQAGNFVATRKMALLE